MDEIRIANLILEISLFGLENLRMLPYNHKCNLDVENQSISLLWQTSIRVGLGLGAPSSLWAKDR